MIVPTLARRAIVALIGLGIAACSGTPAPATSPAPTPTPPDAGTHAAHAPTAAAPQRLGNTSADVRFLQHMVPHHAQALVMTAMVPGRTSNDAIRLMADRIAVSQRDEIAQMQRWLRQHGQAVPAVDTIPAAGNAHADHAIHGADTTHANMPGMLTPAELTRLAGARGAEFDRLFLQSMIRHHEGALTMVSDLLAAGGAQESGLFALASEIESDQQMEIARMQRLLATMR